MSLDCRLVDVNSDIFTDILRLNSEVFPSNELVAPINLSNNIYANDENLSIFSFYNDNEFVGYSAIYSYENISYLAFLAVCVKYQGRGFGGLILEILKSNFSQIVLEIESLDPKATDYLQRVKRSKFYNNHGFKDSGYKISYCKMTYSIYSNFEFDSKQFIDMFNLFKSKNYFDFKFE
ncbi:ribosomal-protein-alanine acetyltransferase [Campylobacter devanensis]|uniref:Acetyltransferase n=1 Tax=Campylobacter devanensis TaxID=3161138 RepID=A0A1X9SU81_9BACT|nr:GNAT family N-acetyltransferase [Campylobacter lanienae]ARQ99833.1 acetyltransferase [Campylobacter lanienae]SUX03085.1 ribosomal-protein-alanine acetyltransferase [Campylobacter lanienae]